MWSFIFQIAFRQLPAFGQQRNGRAAASTALQCPAGTLGLLSPPAQYPLVLLLLLNITLVLIHVAMETSATLILVVLLVLPVFAQVGIDPTHLGIVFLVNSALALLVPPLSPVLYVAAPLTRLRMETIARATPPSMLALLVDLVPVSEFPKISTIVPATAIDVRTRLVGRPRAKSKGYQPGRQLIEEAKLRSAGMNRLRFSIGWLCWQDKGFIGLPTRSPAPKRR